MQGSLRCWVVPFIYLFISNSELLLETEVRDGKPVLPCSQPETTRVGYVVQNPTSTHGHREVPTVTYDHRDVQTLEPLSGRGYRGDL